MWALQRLRPGSGAAVLIPTSLLRYLTFKLTWDLQQVCAHSRIFPGAQAVGPPTLRTLCRMAALSLHQPSQGCVPVLDTQWCLIHVSASF